MQTPVPTIGCLPGPIVRGPDGTYWFVEYWPVFQEYCKIGRITTNHAVFEYPLPTKNSKPTDITVGPDHNLWFTESGISRIGRVTPGGVVNEFLAPPGTVPAGIATGSDGRIWVTDGGPAFLTGTPTNGGVMAFTLVNGLPVGVTYYNAGLTPHSRPGKITRGPDGNLWFVERLTSKIGRITPAGVIKEFTLPNPLCQPADIITGPDGALWFSEYGANKLGRITTAGAITEFKLPPNPIPTVINRPLGLTVGADSNIWYADPGGSFIARTIQSGSTLNVTRYLTPTNYFPQYIASGPDGSLWFSQSPGNSPGFLDFIGRFAVTPSLSITTTNSQVVLSWPATGPITFTLQSSTNAASTNWTKITNAPVIRNGRYVVTNNVTAGAHFYRLK